MKKIFIIALLFILVLTADIYAQPSEFSGGVNDEYNYEEYIFLSGTPVKFKGTYTITETERGDDKTIGYVFKLKPEDKTRAGKLDRQMTYIVKKNQRTDRGQTINDTQIAKYKETIEVGGKKYELKDYQFSKSDIVDNRPASDFYSGNIIAKKYYSINKDEGSLTMSISGGDAGYKNFWGASETILLNYDIDSEQTNTTDTGSTIVKWHGTLSIQATDTMTKKLDYYDNEAEYSSFYGGNIRQINRSLSAKIKYELPLFKNEKPDAKLRSRGDLWLTAKMMPKVERLVVPKFRDVRGHWAEEYINKLYSLDVFDDVNEFFVPDVSMTRIDFIKAVLRSCNIRTEVETKKTVSRKTVVKEESPYADIKTDDKNYEFIKDADAKGLTKGITKSFFMPDEPLTKAQTITILIRALGFDSKAPNPGYKTQFSDDSKIGEWAKDSVYMAKEIGLIQGDSNNRLNPNKVLTRAEASAMLVRFLQFLEKDLQKDYTDNIILY